MYDNHKQGDHPPICNLVPGFAFYNDMGSSLAENLVDLFEAAAELIADINRRARHEASADTKLPYRRQVSTTLASQHDPG